MSALPAVNPAPLTETEAEAAFGAVLDGEIGDAEIADFLIALSDRGETASEIAGAARAMRAKMCSERAAAPSSLKSNLMSPGTDSASGSPTRRLPSG